MTTQSFFKDKNILITGHTGFKGAWLTAILNNWGAKVTGLALPADEKRWGLVNQGIKPNTKEYFLDIRDINRIRKALHETQPEIIFHLAAQALVIPSYEDPLTTFSTNAMGTANLLQASLELPTLRSFINITSDKCYDNLETGQAYKETDNLGGHDPYSASKGCAEIVCSSYRKSFYQKKGIPLPSVRAGNVIGGGDSSAFRICPDFAEAFAAGTPAIIRNPKAIRPWQHVLEPLSAYLMLAEKSYSSPELVSRPWNIGPNMDACKPVSELAELAVRAWGNGASVRTEVNPLAVHEATFLHLDSSDVRELIGWKPRLSFEEAITWTFDWYKRRSAGESGLALCQEQIEKFFNP